MSSIFRSLTGPGVIGEDQRLPKLTFNQRSPQADAILSKLLPDPNPTVGSTDGLGRKRQHAPDVGLLNRIAEQQANDNNDAESMFQLLPELELVRQILVSSILSPKDMVTSELNYSVENSAFDTELTGPLLQVVTDHFGKVYKIESILPEILSDILFMKGSYPLVVLPENSIDEAINSPYRISTESLRDEINDKGQPVQIGLLGNPGQRPSRNGIALENFSNLGKAPAQFTVNMGSLAHNAAVKETDRFDPMISITDNPSVLKFPILAEKSREDRIQQLLSLRGAGSKVSMEGRLSRKAQRRAAFDAMDNGSNLERSLYRRRRYGFVPLLQVKTREQLQNDAVGNPLVMHLPSESVIPVHVPGNPKEHVGYFVLLDEYGNPVTRAQETDYYNQLATNINNRSQVSQLLNTAARGQEGREPDQQRDHEDFLRAYTDMVERDLLERLQNGVYGDGGVEVAKPEEIYRIMFARACASMKTQLLYVPVQLMTYMAFDYNKWGLGASLLDNSKILGGLRSILLFSNTMAAIKNSVGRVGVKIHLDPKDPDPTGTVEELLHEYSKTRSGGYPLGASNPQDIISFLQNAAIDVAVEGNSGYPETTFNVEDRQSQKAMVDSDLEDRLRKSHIMAMGLSPEAVDATQNVEFAASVVSSNLLLSKRVKLYQERFTEFLSDFIHKYAINSGALMESLAKVLEENESKLTEEDKKVDREIMLVEFINSITVSLPAPDAATLENQLKAYQTFSEGLDAILNAYYSEDFLAQDSLGIMAEHVPVVKAATKAHYQREWLRKNNVMPELNELTMFDEKGGAFDLLGSVESHLEGLAQSISGFVKKMLEAKAKRDKEQEDLNSKLGIQDTGGMGGGDQSGGGNDNMDFGGGLDNLDTAAPGADGGGDLNAPNTDAAAGDAGGEAAPTDDQGNANADNPDANADDLNTPTAPNV